MSPGRGRLRPADRSPPQLSAAVGDGAATRRIGGSAEQRAGGGQSAPVPPAFVSEAFLCCSRGLAQSCPVKVCQRTALGNHGGLC